MERLCERYGRKSVYILGVISAFILYIIISLCVQYFSQTFRWEDTAIRLVKQTNQGAIFKDRDSNLLNVEIQPGRLNKYFFVMTVQYLDKALIYDSTDSSKGIVFTLSDGSTYTENLFPIDYKALGLSPRPEPTKPSDVRLIEHILSTMDKSLSTSTLVMYSFLCLILILMGFMNIVYPEIVWGIRYCMDVEGGEPSSFYIATCRLGGYIIVGIVLLAPVFYLISIKI